MSGTVSEFVIDRLIEWDLHQFYGFPGDGIGGFDGALERAESDGKDFRYIRPTHEEIAAFMACAHAKFTGGIGVCIATSGPGAVHLLNGLYDAKMDNQPVVAIVGQQGRVSSGSHAHQEVKLERVFADVAGYVQTVTTPMHAELVVDRAFQMLGVNELLTVKRYWKTWEDPRFIVLVLHNDDLTQVSWEMREVGDPRWDTSQLVEDMDYAAYAEVLGLRGICVDKPDQVADAWDAAFAADRPVVLDVHTDPNVPPLPAHISFAEAKGFFETVLKGDPAERAVIGNSVRAVGAELFAHARNALSRDKNGENGKH